METTLANPDPNSTKIIRSARTTSSWSQPALSRSGIAQMNALLAAWTLISVTRVSTWASSQLCTPMANVILLTNVLSRMVSRLTPLCSRENASQHAPWVTTLKIQIAPARGNVRPQTCSGTRRQRSANRAEIFVKSACRWQSVTNARPTHPQRYTRKE